MKAFLIAAAALIAAGSASAQGTRVFPTSEKPALDDVYPDRVTRFPGGVTGLSDVVFSTIPGYRPMIVDIYKPATKSPKPLILYVHGGGWVGGHTRHSGALADFPKALAKLASEGFVVASLEYRLADEASFPAQLQDARAALRFLKANATKYGIDPARSGIWGGSAGGHLSSLAALSCGDASLDPKDLKAPAGSECVQAAVIWYGVFDFAALAAGRPGGNDGAAVRLLRCQTVCNPSDYAPASPVTYIDAKDPPHLLIHGEGDRVVPVAQSRLAEAKLRESGVPVESIYIPGVDHSFIGSTPATTRAATLKATNATFDFFHKVLRK